MADAGAGQAATLLWEGGQDIRNNAGQGNLASAELYDPTTGSWTATIRLHDGTVLVAGGANGRGALASAELYDPGSGS